MYEVRKKHKLVDIATVRIQVHYLIYRTVKGLSYVK